MIVSCVCTYALVLCESLLISCNQPLWWSALKLCIRSCRSSSRLYTAASTTCQGALQGKFLLWLWLVYVLMMLFYVYLCRLFVISYLVISFGQRTLPLQPQLQVLLVDREPCEVNSYSVFVSCECTYVFV